MTELELIQKNKGLVSFTCKVYKKDIKVKFLSEILINTMNQINFIDKKMLNINSGKKIMTNFKIKKLLYYDWII